MIDKTILHGLFCQHYSEMIHLARTLLYTEEEAEDTVQDVFMRFMETSQEGESLKNAKAYLMTAVRNSCINRIRQKSLTEQVKGLYSIDVQTDMRYVEQRLEALHAVCDYADQHLPEPHRSIFRLRFQEGLTLKEIAQQLDMNLKTVFKYLSQSIQNVQKQFRK